MISPGAQDAKIFFFILILNGIVTSARKWLEWKQVTRWFKRNGAPIVHQWNTLKKASAQDASKGDAHEPCT
jgi:hypothetical protein